MSKGIASVPITDLIFSQDKKMESMAITIPKSANIIGWNVRLEREWLQARMYSAELYVLHADDVFQDERKAHFWIVEGAVVAKLPDNIRLVCQSIVNGRTLFLFTLR